MSAIQIIQALGRKIAAKKSKTPEGITRIQPQIYAESEAGRIAATLQDAGIPLNRLDDFIKSEADLVRILNQIKAIEKKNLAENIRSGIRNTETGKVFDMEGKEIKNPKNIMGGKEVKETEAEIAKRIGEGNKQAAKNLRMKKIVDDAIDNMSPSLSGDTRTDAALVAEDMAERMGKVYDDLSSMERLDLYDQAYTGLSKIRFKGFKKPKDDPEDMAQGGRAGFDNGGAPSIKLFPKASGRQIEGEVGPGLKISQRDLNYGITGLLQGDKFFGGAELDKGKVKIDVVTPDGDTLFKDTIGKKDAVNFILGIGDPQGEKFQIKTDKDFDNMQLILKKSFATGGRAGFFMGSANPRGLGLLKELLNFFGKKSDVVKNPSDVLRVINPKAFNKMLEDAKGKVMPKEGIMATDAIKDYQTQMAKDRVEMVKDMIERGKRFKAADNKIVGYKNAVKEKFMKDLNMSEKEAEQAAERMATLAMDMTKMEKTPKITDEGLLQLENVLKNMETGGKKARDLNADGGRIGYKVGSIDKARRAFLKAAAGIGGGIAALKTGLLNIGKGADAVKNLPPIKTPVTQLEGTTTQMPEWFPSFINKFRDEGKAENVFKQKKVAVSKAEYDQAAAEGKLKEGNYFMDPRTPEYIAKNPDHSLYNKLVDTDERIYTTYTNDKVPGVRVDDMDGNVDVMFENEYSQPVSLNYTAPGKRGPETGRADEFIQGEAKIETKPEGEFVANDVETYATDPDGGYEAVDVIADTVDDMLEGTTRTMEEYATGKKVKGISKGEGRVIEAEIRAEQAADAAAEAAADAAAEAADEFSSGGIARMLGE